MCVCLWCESGGIIISDNMSYNSVLQAIAKKERRKASIERLFLTQGAKKSITEVLKAAVQDLKKEEDAGERTPISTLQVRERV